MAQAQSFEDFNYECIDAHNGLRHAHGIGALIYSEALAKAAQAYAEVIARKNVLQHSSDAERGANIGENIAMRNAPHVGYVYSGLGASVSWYSEIKDYDFSLEEQVTNMPTGHFTQVIWKATNEAGFGRAKASNGSWFIVGRYNCAGNLVGSYRKNVPDLIYYSDWIEVPMVNQWLDELNTWEYCAARRHILDDWQGQMAGKIKSGKKFFTITETYTTPSGETYSASKEFEDEDPMELPRPEFEFKPLDADGGSIHSASSDDSKLRHYSSDDENLLGMDSFRDEEIHLFCQQILQRHNYHRKRHGLSDLKMDKSLSDYAQDWADDMAARKQCGFSEYRFMSDPIGENITCKNGELRESSGEKLVDSWYSENRFYAYGSEPKNFEKIGHFSQLVWRNTKKIGVGIKKDNTNHFYIAVFYHPAGNVENSFSLNIPQPIF